MRNNCVALILSHGRPDRVHTLRALERAGYTGDWRIIIDNEDATADEYYRRYGDRVIMFDKAEEAARTETWSPSDERRTIIFARNAAFRIADELGADFHIQLDDDYVSLDHRVIEGRTLRTRNIENFDAVLDAMCDFLNTTPACTIAMCQGGDVQGGAKVAAKRASRKAMNSFVFRKGETFRFQGLINEDVNSYTLEGSRGQLFFTTYGVQLVQHQTQSNAGGMTDAYLATGTYSKSFYTILGHPSSVHIEQMGLTHKRLHHHVNWDCTVPKILSPTWKHPKP